MYNVYALCDYGHQDLYSDYFWLNRSTELYGEHRLVLLLRFIFLWQLAVSFFAMPGTACSALAMIRNSVGIGVTTILFTV